MFDSSVCDESMSISKSQSREPFWEVPPQCQWKLPRITHLHPLASANCLWLLCASISIEVVPGCFRCCLYVPWIDLSREYVGASVETAETSEVLSVGTSTEFSRGTSAYVSKEFHPPPLVSVQFNSALLPPMNSDVLALSSPSSHALPCTSLKLRATSHSPRREGKQTEALTEGRLKAAFKQIEVEAAVTSIATLGVSNDLWNDFHRLARVPAYLYLFSHGIHFILRLFTTVLHI